MGRARSSLRRVALAAATVALFALGPPFSPHLGAHSQRVDAAFHEAHLDSFVDEAFPVDEQWVDVIGNPALDGGQRDPG